MFNVREIEEEIEKMKKEKMTWDSVMKLAHLYIVRENLEKDEYANSGMVGTGYGEFSGRVRGKSRIGFKSMYEREREDRYNTDDDFEMNHGGREGREMSNGYAGSNVKVEESVRMLRRLSKSDMCGLLEWVLKRMKTQNPREYRAIADAIEELANE